MLVNNMWAKIKLQETKNFVVFFFFFDINEKYWISEQIKTH